MTVRELLERIDSRELTEWSAYYGLEPWGEDRADLRAGTIAATIANAHGAKAKPSDFMPDYRAQYQPPQERTPEEVQDMVKKLNAMLGGRFKTQNT